MLKEIIIIENGEKCQCSNEEEVVKLLIDSNYYKLTEKEKREKMEMRAIANTINNKMQILKPNEIKQDTDINNKFILLDEKTYILSLLITNNITILERIDSNIYTEYLDKSKFEKNYIIVNNFAKEILKQYLANKAI